MSNLKTSFTKGAITLMQIELLMPMTAEDQPLGLASSLDPTLSISWPGPALKAEYHSLAATESYGFSHCCKNFKCTSPLIRSTCLLANPAQPPTAWGVYVTYHWILSPFLWNLRWSSKKALIKATFHHTPSCLGLWAWVVEMSVAQQWI